MNKKQYITLTLKEISSEIMIFKIRRTLFNSNRIKLIPQYARIYSLELNLPIRGTTQTNFVAKKVAIKTESHKFFVVQPSYTLHHGEKRKILFISPHQFNNEAFHLYI